MYMYIVLHKLVIFPQWCPTVIVVRCYYNLYHAVSFYSEISCDRLTNPLNGQVQFSSSSIGSIATYTCNNGYNLVGSIHQRICRPDGEWSGEEPRCASKWIIIISHSYNNICDTLPLSFSPSLSFSLSLTLFLSLSLSLSLSLPHSLSFSLFLIVVDCGILPEPLFGTVDFTSTTFQSKSTYLCNDGFMLSEQVTRICQANGIWSGSAPFCQRKTVTNIIIIM